MTDQVYGPFVTSVSIPNRFTHPSDVLLAVEPTKRQVQDIDKKKYRACVLIHGTEPPGTTSGRIDSAFICENADKFDLIMSFDDSIVDRFDHAIPFQFGSCWLSKKEREEISFGHKKPKLSFIRSANKRLPGHKLRHQINFDYLNKQIQLFFPKERIPRKAPLFQDSMFHVCTENSQFRNYFTEKIVDCFSTFTIPIYWGCPNISDFWDPDGLVVFESIEHLNSILSELTIDMYHEKLPAILHNKQIAEEKYADFYSRISLKINKLFNT